jgi:hypothetical protein
MKSTNHLAIQQLARLIDESLVLLKQASIDEPYPQSMDAPVASLLDQCLALCEQHHSILQEPLRVIYHFGLPVDSTLLASVATLANTCVLREIDLHANVKPFDNHALTAKTISECYISNIENNVFEPNALLTHLASLQQQCHQRGQRLLLCHNPYALPVVDDNLLDLSTSLPQHFSVQALIVVADPVDSYASYCASSSMDKTLDFEDYCQRTLDFIEAHADLTIIRHEDFVSAPKEVMQQLCTVLDLPFNEDFLLLREAFL